MNTNDYLALNFKDIKDYSDLYPQSRRDFLKQLGGGIIVCVVMSEFLAAQAQESRRFRGFGRGLPSDFNAFLRIDEHGRVTGYTGKIEMGQGPITSLPQMLAEELDTPLGTVDIVMGDTDLCPWDMGTFGSMTTRMFGPALQAAAAEAKAVLLELAAESLKVPPAQLAAKDGVIFDKENPEHRVTYGQLTQGKKIERHIEGKPSLKDPSRFTVVGQPELHRDGRAKVTGAAHYAGDIRLPGMLYAKILRPPAHDAKLKSVDTAPAKEIPGVQVVQDKDFQGKDLIAVLHEFPDVAEDALGQIKAEFDVPEATVDDKNIFDHLLSVAPPANVLTSGGDLAAGRKLAAKTIEATYLDGYVAHSAMETHTALAQIEAGKATVWASTQNPFGAQGEIARALGLPAEKVRVITPFVGGGFGGKTYNQQAVEAAQLAKIVGKPVQVMWSREEEFFYDTFQPAAIVKISSGVDGSGKMAFWDYDVYYAGDRGAQQFYTVPNHRTSGHGRGWQGSEHPFHTGAWRAPGNNTNTFARESHVDQLATAAGIDPVEFRLNNLSDDKMIRVLQAAAETFGWTPAKAPSKRGYGVACGIDAGTYVAAIAEVAVDAKTGAVQVKRVACAQDMGLVVNPEGAKIQMEGCITMGMGYALTEEIHFKGRKVLDTNYDTYEIPRFTWVPKMDTVILDARNHPPQGGGEPAIVVMGAVIANAIHDATGARLCQLPMTPDRVKAAIQKT
ncbi:MAG TPA: molybdopterin cofactor-binding domain-containing protein [Verrucomicrobiae bacterium]|nr:molybdopterin cofactor-binding domain-containing protein [Verrucomicrobiae bacterium]